MDAALAHLVEPDLLDVGDALVDAAERAALEEVGRVHGVAGGAQLVGERVDAGRQALGVVEQQDLRHRHLPGCRGCVSPRPYPNGRCPAQDDVQSTRMANAIRSASGTRALVRIDKEDDMALTLGILALVEAKPGKEAQVEAFVKAGQGIVEQEPGTRVWYGFKVDDSTFGIFDAFEDEAARQAHLSGQIPAALAAAGPELLAKDPDIRLVDVLAVKG